MDKLDKLEKTIKKFGKVFKALTELAIEIGTFLAIVKMILDSLS